MKKNGTNKDQSRIKRRVIYSKKIRKNWGIEPGTNVLFSIVDNKVQVKVINDLENLYNQKKMKIKVSLEELKAERKKLSSDAEK